MGFDTGSISFRRFAVVGTQPDAIDQKLLEALSEHALRPDDSGIAAEIEYGWNGGRHVLDDAFSFDNNVFAESLHFALRIDTNKVPSELTRAYKLMEEDAAAKSNPSGFISRKQKKSARENAQARVDEALHSGKYRRSKLVPILWDLPNAVLYCNASIRAEEQLQEIFDRTFNLTLDPLSSGALAQRILVGRGRRRDYEDVHPTRFVTGPEGESQVAEYPWVAKGPQAKDFLGNEFALWLWHQAFVNEGIIEIGKKNVTVFFDRTLDLDCAFGASGRDSLRGDGVTQMPEALDALRSGKVPRKAGLIVESAGSQFQLTLNAESLAVASLKLPNIEDADGPRVLFEERIALLRDFSTALDELFGHYLKTRAGSTWEGQTTTIRKWIGQSTRAMAAVA